MTKTTPQIEAQVKAYRAGETQGRAGQPAAGKHPDPKVQVAYEAGHGYGVTAQRKGWK